MRSLDDYNTKAFESYWSHSQPKRNGIKCPHCDGELIDTCPGEQFMSQPPQTAVHCESCAYRGRRVCG